MAKGYSHDSEWVDYFLRELRRMIDCKECAEGYAAMLARHYPDDKFKQDPEYGKTVYKGLVQNLVQFLEAYSKRIRSGTATELLSWLPQTLLSFAAITIALISLI